MSEPTIRAATSADMPHIRELHRNLEDRMQRSMDLPEVDVEYNGEIVPNPALLGFWVVEKDATVVQFFYIEKALELCMGGEDPQALQAVQEFQQEILPVMLASSARMLHCHVPQEFPHIGRHLEDASFTATGYIHYHLGLVPA